MRIAIVVGSFPTISETFIVNQINSLIEEVHEVEVFSYRKMQVEHVHPSITKFDLLERVHYFKKRGNSTLKNWFYLFKWFLKNAFHIQWGDFLYSLNFLIHGRQALSLELFFAAQWFLSHKEFDILHVHFGPHAEKIAALKAKGFLKNSKLISTFHGFDLIPNNSEVYNERYNNLIKESTAFTVNSPYLKNILSELKVKAAQIHILPVGLDTSDFKRNMLKKRSSFRILFCGRLIKLKGPDIALDIFIELRRRGHKTVELTMIGDGPLREEICEKIRVEELENSVLFLGALSQEFVKLEMNSADIFLMPGIHDPLTGRAETQGLVLQEAQAMELPVILSDVGGMKYGVLHNETGFVVNEGDVGSFADAVESLMKDNRLCKTMGKNGRKYVVANFDNKILYSKLIKIYQSAL